VETLHKFAELKRLAMIHAKNASLDVRKSYPLGDCIFGDLLNVAGLQRLLARQ
jgi:hypothetical protein